MDWRFSSFLLFLFALLIGVPWATSESGLCGLAVAQKAMAGTEATTCFEFWLNRYQTLAGAVIALIAAWIATIPVRGQLREMARQSAASARQSAIDLADTLEAEMLLTRKIGSLWAPITALIQSYDRDPWGRIYDTWPQKWRDYADQLRTCFTEFGIMMARARVGDPHFNLRFVLADELQKMHTLMCEIDEVFYASTGGPDYENGGRDYTEEEAAQIRDTFDAAFDRCMNASKELHDAVVSGFTEAWQNVRQLEQKMIEP